MATVRAVIHVDCVEADELTSRLQGITALAVPLCPERYTGTLSRIDLGDISIEVVRSTPVLMLVSVLGSRISLMQILKGSKRARWNGAPVERDSVAVLKEGEQHAARYPDNYSCILLSFRAGPASGMADLAREAALPRAAKQGIRIDRDARSTLAQIGRAIETTIATSPEDLEAPEARCSLRASLFETMHDLLASAEDAPSCTKYSRVTHQRLVHQADEYLRANPARPVYTAELRTVLGTSATRLHQAFVLTVGISPHRYLKMRRMGMVRSMLLARAGPWHSVKAAALSHGFWHLGQFAHDYRAVYGELPSQTLARARPGVGDDGDVSGEPWDGYDLARNAVMGQSHAKTASNRCQVAR